MLGGGGGGGEPDGLLTLRVISGLNGNVKHIVLPADASVEDLRAHLAHLYGELHACMHADGPAALGCARAPITVTRAS